MEQAHKQNDKKLIGKNMQRQQTNHKKTYKTSTQEMERKQHQPNRSDKQNLVLVERRRFCL
jgi:hypothetical protein